MYGIDAVVQVLTETTLPYQLLQIHVGGANQADIHRDSLGAAYAHRAANEAEEERLVREAMERSGGNISSAAKILGVSRPTLYAKLRKYGL